MGTLLRPLVNANRTISRGINALLPAAASKDGNRSFIDEVVPAQLSGLPAGATIFELGGGSQPIIATDLKARKAFTVVGLDIDAGELAAAPAGSYDREVVADLCTYRGAGDADLVICQATLEHVTDVAGAIRGIASTLRAGSRACIFVPSRRALYARLNRRLPQALKERILYAASPEVEDHQGFPAPYDRCTPTEIAALLEQSGMRVVELRLHWTSSYFMVFVPAFLAWRAWQVVDRLWKGRDAAETFIIVAEKLPE